MCNKKIVYTGSFDPALCDGVSATFIDLFKYLNTHGNDTYIISLMHTVSSISKNRKIIEKMKRSKIAVIGIGNYLMCDEGAGLHAIEMLRKKKFKKDVDLVEAGTPGMNLLHQFEERETVVFIDSGNCGLKAGEFIRFRPDEVKSLKGKKNLSLHEFDLITFLEAASKLGKTKNIDIIIYCIQAAEIKMSMEPSEKVKKSLAGLVKKVYSDINNGELNNA